jgi:ribonucleoside-triphosphate reductase
MDTEDININTIHNVVERVLEYIKPEVAKSYRDYRNYKQDFVHMLDRVYQENQRIMYLGDKENSNIDSTLVSTKRSLVYNELSKELYKKFFLTVEELQAIKDGYIYVHDMSARLNTMNCCLFDIAKVLKGGFELGNIWYNEPKTLDVAFDVIGDIVMSASSQQYGGFTVPEVDKILELYAQKSFDKYFEDYISLGVEPNIATDSAMNKVQKDFEQGFQGWEYKFNTVASSRGDYPFITVTTGLSTTKFGQMCNLAMLKVRANGQGKEGNKKPVLFPKIVFLYDKNLHGNNKILHHIYKAGIECSKKAMYPDWLSLTGEGYVAEMYKKYGRVISPMGCRAFLSPWFERGGATPIDENDKPIFVGRFNIGAVSLHLPMIYAKAQKESKDFYEVLDYYMQLIRKIHIRTYNYLGEMKASINPLAYCEGGFYGGNLSLDDKIKPLLKSATASFGITALNELQQLHNRKSLVEDGNFAIEVMEYINKKVAEFKAEDGHLYALYGTPAENLCGVQVDQFRRKYGIVENVSDRGYVSNSFHCHVSEDITPIQKQDCEKRFWDLLNGGKIQYVKYPLNYNTIAIDTLV